MHPDHRYHIVVIQLGERQSLRPQLRVGGHLESPINGGTVRPAGNGQRACGSRRIAHYLTDAVEGTAGNDLNTGRGRP